MLHLLNLFAAIALLIWATQLVRTGVLRLFGAALRRLLAVSMDAWPQGDAVGRGGDLHRAVEHRHRADRVVLRRQGAGGDRAGAGR